MDVDAASPDDRGYRDPGTVVSRLRLAVIVQAGLEAARLVLRFAVTRSFGVGEPLWTLRGVVDLASIPSWIATAAIFTWWVRLIVVNARILHPFGVRSRAWSGLWVFAPVANLFMPFLVLRDLWDGTHRAGVASAPRPASPPAPRLVLAWWVTLVGSLGWTHVSFVVRRWLWHFDLFTLSDVVTLSAGVLGLLELHLLFRVVSAISGAQAAQRSDYVVEPELLPPRRA